MAPGTDRGEGWRGADVAMQITGLMLAGIMVWGGVGYLLDRWIGFHWIFLPVGMLLGLGTSLYLVYIKHGRNDPEA